VPVDPDVPVEGEPDVPVPVPPEPALPLVVFQESSSVLLTEPSPFLSMLVNTEVSDVPLFLNSSELKNPFRSVSSVPKSSIVDPEVPDIEPDVVDPAMAGAAISKENASSVVTFFMVIVSYRCGLTLYTNG
jgi:hypothetical protein